MSHTTPILRVPIYSPNNLEDIYNVVPSNILIAKFYGWKRHTIKSTDQCDVELYRIKNINGLARDIQFDYHKNWGSLMPVVEKIERTGAIAIIGENYCSITLADKSRKFEDTYNCKIGAVWLCVLRYIYWHNAQLSKEDF